MTQTLFDNNLSFIFLVGGRGKSSSSTSEAFGRWETSIVRPPYSRLIIRKRVAIHIITQTLLNNAFSFLFLIGGKGRSSPSPSLICLMWLRLDLGNWIRLSDILRDRDRIVSHHTVLPGYKDIFWISDRILIYSILIFITDFNFCARDYITQLSSVIWVTFSTVLVSLKS